MHKLYCLIAVILMFGIMVQMMPMALAEESDTETAPQEPVSAFEITKEDVCYAYTPAMVSDVFRYLDEIYIEKYPEMGLRFLYGDEEVKEILTNLATVITEGCDTDTEKAKAIMDWVGRNIEYDANAHVFPIDVFYLRRGGCVGYAQLVAELLRLSGIPAVFSDGWIGNMKRTTPQYWFNEMSLSGHAWCFAYLEGQWAMLDPLWEEDPITDRDYIAKRYYIRMVEGVAPVYESELVPHSCSVFYINGEFMDRWDDGTTVLGAGVVLLNFELSYQADYREISKFGGSDGHEYLYDPEAKEDMVNGQVYRDGWLLVGSETYAYETGVQAASRTMLRQGRLYYIAQQTHHAFEVLADAQDYDILGGLFSVRTGYQGKPLETTSLFLNRNRILEIEQYEGFEKYDIRWESSDPEIATVDENGVITALKEGTTQISAHFYYGPYNGTTDNYMGCSSAYTLQVTDYVVEVDYSDNKSGHKHTYTQISVEPTCTRNGYEIHTCTKRGCADSYIGTEIIPATGHSFENGLCSICGVGDGSLPHEVFPDSYYSLFLPVPEPTTEPEATQPAPTEYEETEETEETEATEPTETMASEESSRDDSSGDGSANTLIIIGGVMLTCVVLIGVILWSPQDEKNKSI